MNLVTRASLSQQLLRNLPVLLPPQEEQKEIAQYLEYKNNNFNLAIKKLEDEISLCSEYKNSLISSVVTGQVDVRNITVEDVSPDNLVQEDDDSADPDKEQPETESEE